ncbi:hypothetical protein L3X38_012088 [Prunus dulcis]|uniref:Reverse transcriptase Ty1/copia-type domain-containing protein n=1 Tax=Prunus dulcis TaxID=3755 RepID=A0AAD4ZG19_PRUDU|nr:hypothetical protein L3X38_012088 [Prunus dulcis]
MVRGLPCLDTSSKVCEDCLVGKQRRDPFPRESTWRASQILDMVHANTCGPISPMSNSNRRSPTLAVKNIIPEEAWSGFKPTVDHFRVFGYVSHVHVFDCKRTKLDDKSVRCDWDKSHEEVILAYLDWTNNNKEPYANARNEDDAELEGFNGTDEGNMSNSVEKYKARLVAKGYTQKHGVDYTEVVAPIARSETVRLVVSLATQQSSSASLALAHL